MMVSEDTLFTLSRRDKNGLRIVYNLGNEFGDCPYRCKFCTVGRSPRVTSSWNIKEFDRQHERFLDAIDGPYHPLIYNQGNVTNLAEFSRQTLSHILHAFEQDPRIVFVSLNSRARYATSELLLDLAKRRLPFPIHFIFGIESFSPKAADIFGKDTRGELERFIEQLKPFNFRGSALQPEAGYTFGLDANLVFLPEMYLSKGEPRRGNEEKIAAGICAELRHLLSLIDSSVPVEINLHPYHVVAALPYDDLDLEYFMGVLPKLHRMVNLHNIHHPERASRLFVGVEGSGFDSEFQKLQVSVWKDRIDLFNETGQCDWAQIGIRHGNHQ